MSVSPSTQSSRSPIPSLQEQSQRIPGPRPPPLQQQATASYASQQPTYNPAASPPITPRYPQNGMQSPQYQTFPLPTPTNGAFRRPDSYVPQHPQTSQPYNPNSYGPVSPPAHQQYFSPPPGLSYGGGQPATTHYGQQQTQFGGSHQSMPPPGWQPPPPPPGPPPSQEFGAHVGGQYPAGPGGYADDPRRSQQPQQPQHGSGDPWAGLTGWK